MTKKWNWENDCTYQIPPSKVLSFCWHSSIQSYSKFSNLLRGSKGVQFISGVFTYKIQGPRGPRWGLWVCEITSLLKIEDDMILMLYLYINMLNDQYKDTSLSDSKVQTSLLVVIWENWGLGPWAPGSGRLRGLGETQLHCLLVKSCQWSYYTDKSWLGPVWEEIEEVQAVQEVLKGPRGLERSERSQEVLRGCSSPGCWGEKSTSDAVDRIDGINEDKITSPKWDLQPSYGREPVSAAEWQRLSQALTEPWLAAV